MATMRRGVGSKRATGWRMAVTTSAVVLLAVTGCASDSPGEWENPSKPFEVWGQDRAECRQLATERAEQELTSAQTEQLPTSWSRTATFEQSMSRFEAGRRRDELFARCMTERGYRLVPRAH